MQKNKISLSSILYLAVYLVFATHAYADDKDTFNAIAGINWQHDDNLFRLPKGVNLAPAQRSDQVTSGFVGIRIDKQYALQRFKFNFTHSANRYQNNTSLKFDTNEYSAAWLWSLTPYLTGNLSSERSEGRDTSQDVVGQKVFNVSTTVNHRFDVDWSPYGNWHMLAGVANYRLKNSQANNGQAGYTQNSINGGVRYVFGSGSAMSLIGYGRSANYDQRQLISTSFLDTGFGEREVDANLNWVLTGKSRINLMAGYLHRNYDNFTQRNFSQPVASAEYVWTPTGRIQISALIARQVSGYESTTSSYTVRDMLSITPSWSITDKISLQGNVNIADRKFKGNGSGGTIARDDSEKSASIGISWLPWRYLTLGANLQHSSRSSNQPGIDFTDNTAGISAQLFY
ncbi:MAG: XrtB/PEP-CTERM-associated polysaccharide biosynthesis outer membrane protein EpsL [Methylophilaceae bacterium]